jgi:hypothetical protein
VYTHAQVNESERDMSASFMLSSEGRKALRDNGYDFSTHSFRMPAQRTNSMNNNSTNTNHEKNRQPKGRSPAGSPELRQRHLDLDELADTHHVAPSSHSPPSTRPNGNNSPAKNSHSPAKKSPAKSSYSPAKTDRSAVVHRDDSVNSALAQAQTLLARMAQQQQLQLQQHYSLQQEADDRFLDDGLDTKRARVAGDLLLRYSGRKEGAVGPVAVLVRKDGTAEAKYPVSSFCACMHMYDVVFCWLSICMER